MTMTSLRVVLFAGVSAFAAAACQPAAEAPAPAVETAAAPAPAPAPFDYAALLSAPTRPAADAADDAARKPAELLAFAGVQPGHTVVEIEAGAGYFTELLSGVVGPTGKVIMQNPPEFDAFAGEAVAARLADNRLGNVVLSKTHFDVIEAPDASVDVVTWMLGPHELFFKPEGVESLGDPTRSYAEIFRVLKPGGSFVVLDHAAAAGAPPETGNTLHRIDPALVEQAAAAAGFTTAESSPLLANPADDHTLGVFDPAIRRKTDQFLIKFVKPAAA